eukprot:TRINITY_DN24618_c0_g1_i2.p1 TRINITY_DN24618_c0_g1~~TRINITY_DN24618_c0_g1_i2.p1  ORF type:complete len:305 (+),score=45.81 TRINITY_DN24618_c0_g1_i2:74-916(+)
MAPLLTPDVLAAALDGINQSGITSKEKWALQKHAVNVFMASPATTMPPPSPDPFDLLDEMYGLLSEAAGTRIARPTAAIAFIRGLGFGELEKRISKLTTKRNHAAHPDNGLLNDLRIALAKLEPSVLQVRAAAFRNKTNNEKDKPHRHVVEEVKTVEKVIDANPVQDSKEVVKSQLVKPCSLAPLGELKTPENQFKPDVVAEISVAHEGATITSSTPPTLASAAPAAPASPGGRLSLDVEDAVGDVVSTETYRCHICREYYKYNSIRRTLISSAPTGSFT